MGIWNNLFEATPRQGYNPGYGAREFRILKSRIRERNQVEHIFGADEAAADTADTMGKHKEGSARVEVKDDQYATRNADFIRAIASATTVGRVRMEVDTRGASKKTINGDDGTNFYAENFSKIFVTTENEVDTLAVTGIFDHDNFVDIWHDYTIGGTKDITSGHLKVANVTAGALINDELGGTYDAVLGDDESVEDALNIGKGRDLIIDAKEWNLFDNTKAYNLAVVDDGVAYTPHTIHLEAVYAKNVYGATWG